MVGRITHGIELRQSFDHKVLEYVLQRFFREGRRSSIIVEVVKVRSHEEGKVLVIVVDELAYAREIGKFAELIQRAELTL